VLALVDESYRAASPGLFVLAAVTVPQNDDAEALRHALRSVAANNKNPFHWRHEAEPRRLAMLGLLSSARLVDVTVVAASPVQPRRQERARGTRVRQLGWELNQLGVTRVVLESRGVQDLADRRVLSGLQQAGWLPRSFAFTHGSKAEPLLWMADAVAGAVAHDLSTTAAHYTDLLPDLRLVAVNM
jgi:hypothetical protein